MTVKIKDWAKFQHFKDRKPPWIKLYRDLLDDISWHELPGEDAKALVMIWLIASESDGELPPMKELAFRLRVTEKSIKSTVSRLSHWLVQSDIKPISDITAISPRYQDGVDGDISAIALTRSQETERETEEETETDKPRGKTAGPPDGVDISVWQDWLKIRKAKRLPWTDTAWHEIQAEILKAGISEDAAIRECCARGWGSFRADWHAKHNGHAETPYQRSMRERVAEFSPGIARKNPNEVPSVITLESH